MAIRLYDVETGDCTIQLHVQSDLRASYDALRKRFKDNRKDFNRFVRAALKEAIREANAALDQATKIKPENHRNGNRIIDGLKQE